MKMIQEKEVRFVDLRFTDTRGKEQHVGVPVSAFGADKFEDGHAFDGSSIAGWKGIQASDMQLMPDAGTAYIDPFMDETTLVISCDVVEPADGKGPFKKTTMMPVERQAAGVIDLDAPVKKNIHAVADRLDKKADDVTVVVLDRDRHSQLIRDIRACGSRIQLIGDGDIAGGLATALPDSEVDMLMGIGAAPEGVITAAGLKTLGGEIQGRLHFRNEEEKARAQKMGISDLDKKFSTDDLAKGNDVMFAATGVTSGSFLRGVRFTAHGAVTHSIVMRSKSRTVRYIEAVHHFEHKETSRGTKGLQGGRHA